MGDSHAWVHTLRISQYEGWDTRAASLCRVEGISPADGWTLPPIEEPYACRTPGRTHRRRRIVRRRRRLPPDEALPRQELRPARRARGDGRYLGPVPLPRHPFRLGHVHPRLQLQAMERSQGHRRRSVDPPLHRGDRTGERHRPEDPLPPPGAQGRLGFRQCALEPRRAARRRARAAAHDRAVPADVHRLLPLRGRLYPGIRRSRGLRRAGRPSAAVARGPRLQRQEGGGDR